MALDRTLAEAALMARLSRERMLRLLTSGQVRGGIIEGRYYVSERSLLSYLDAQKRSERQAGRQAVTAR